MINKLFGAGWGSKDIIWTIVKFKTNHVLQHQHAEHGLHEDRGSLEEENGKKRLGNGQKIRVILTKLPAKIKTSNI